MPELTVIKRGGRFALQVTLMKPEFSHLFDKPRDDLVLKYEGNANSGMTFTPTRERTYGDSSPVTILPGKRKAEHCARFFVPARAVGIVNDHKEKIMLGARTLPDRKLAISRIPVRGWVAQEHDPLALVEAAEKRAQPPAAIPVQAVSPLNGYHAPANAGATSPKIPDEARQEQENLGKLLVLLGDANQLLRRCGDVRLTIEDGKIVVLQAFRPGQVQLRG